MPGVTRASLRLPGAAVGVFDGGVSIGRREMPVFRIAVAASSWCRMVGTVIVAPPVETALVTAGDAATNDNGLTAERLDQYYTEWHVADRLWSHVEDHIDTESCLLVEPSAGEGAFYRRMRPGSLGFDKEPKYPGIITANFFDVTIGGDRDICFVGNPPFGKNSSLAQAFFNHAAREARYIAMILPSTFLKGSMQNKLNFAFHVVFEEEVPPNAFRFEGRLCSVSTTFMIWERREEPRPLWPTETRHPDFEFLPSRDGADFMIQRVGADAGRVHEEFGKSGSAHYFIRSVRGDVRAVMEELRTEFGRVAGYVAAKPSLAMSEIVSLYRERIERRPSMGPLRRVRSFASVAARRRARRLGGRCGRGARRRYKVGGS